MLRAALIVGGVFVCACHHRGDRRADDGEFGGYPSPYPNPAYTPPSPQQVVVQAAPIENEVDTVYLKEGRVRGEVMEDDPTTPLRIKLADGTVRTILRARIDHVEYANGPARSTSSTAALAPFDTRYASNVFSSIVASASSCGTPDGPTGSGRAVITFQPNGTVSGVQIEGGLFPHSAVGACVADLFRGVHVAPFAGAAVTVGKAFEVKAR